MSFESFKRKQKLKREKGYAAIQRDLSRYRELGIDRYVFWGDGCDICKSLNGKVFLIREAEVGTNLPPMHPGCKCTIAAKSNADLFKDRGDSNPLKDTPKFEEWKQRQLNKDS